MKVGEALTIANPAASAPSVLACTVAWLELSSSNSRGSALICAVMQALASSATRTTPVGPSAIGGSPERVRCWSSVSRTDQRTARSSRVTGRAAGRTDVPGVAMTRSRFLVRLVR